MNGSAFKAPWYVDVIGGLLCAAVVAAAWLLVIGPRVDSMRQVTARREAAERRVLEAASQSETARRIAERLEIVEQEIADRPSSLRAASDVNRQLALVNQLATACALETDALGLGRRITGRDYDTIPLEYSGRGTFTAVARLLAALHERAPDMAVMSFVVSGSAQANGGELEVKLVLAWYAAPDAPGRVAQAG